MAERRMFAKTIVLSDAFLDMPLSTRCLYFTLGMLADDDGFVNNPKSIMRQCGASTDDINLLLAKKFILGFEDGIIVIKHWRIHNYIQKDRYIPTKYEEQKALLQIDENNAYTLDTETLVEITASELTDARKKRIDAYKKSELPYSFSYKIRNAFIGECCPICGVRMGVVCRDNEDSIITRSPMPTIQHNIPISKGGTHSLDNISVICKSCNLSIQDTETPSLNNELVVKKWAEICSCNGNVSIGKDRIGKDSIGNNNILSDKQKAQLADNMTPITLEVITYLNEKANTNFKPCTDKTKRCIKARVNEGFTLEDFKKVIDKKVNSWMGTEWQKYLRPETLFGTKFEGYLNETDVKPRGNSFNQMIHTDYDFDEIEKQILWKEP